MYAKLFKVLSWILIAASVVIAILGFVNGFTATNDLGKEVPGVWTNVLLVWAYVLFALPILALILVGLTLGLKDNPKGILRLLLFALLICAIAFVAYLLAPGKELVGYLGVQPDEGTRKLADTALYVTYFAIGGTVLALIVGGCYRLFSGLKK